MLVFNIFLFGVILLAASFSLACIISAWLNLEMFSDKERDSLYKFSNRLLAVCYTLTGVGFLLMFFNH